MDKWTVSDTSDLETIGSTIRFLFRVEKTWVVFFRNTDYQPFYPQSKLSLSQLEERRTRNVEDKMNKAYGLVSIRSVHEGIHFMIS